MEKILTKLSQIKDFSLNKMEKLKMDSSFIEKDNQEYFKEALYLNLNDNSYLYLFENYSNRNASFTITEFFKVSLKLKEKYEDKKINFFIIEKDEILEFEDYLKKLPVSLDKYAPDFEHILLDLTKDSDDNFKTSVKLKLFSEIMKFICKDDELRGLLNFLIK